MSIQERGGRDMLSRYLSGDVGTYVVVTEVNKRCETNPTNQPTTSSPFPWYNTDTVPNIHPLTWGSHFGPSSFGDLNKQQSFPAGLGPFAQQGDIRSAGTSSNPKPGHWPFSHAHTWTTSESLFDDYDMGFGRGMDLHRSGGGDDRFVDDGAGERGRNEIKRGGAMIGEAKAKGAGAPTRTGGGTFGGGPSSARIMSAGAAGHPCGKNGSGLGIMLGERGMGAHPPTRGAESQTDCHGRNGRGRNGFLKEASQSPPSGAGPMSMDFDRTKTLPDGVAVGMPVGMTITSAGEMAVEEEEEEEATPKSLET